MIELGKYKTVVFNPETLDIREEAIYKLLGYSKKAEDEFISDTIEKYRSKSREIIKPAGGYILKEIRDINLQTGILTLSDEKLAINRIIASQLKKAEYLALFVGTIGNSVEKVSEELFQEGDPFEGYIMNLIGSEAAEAVAFIIHETIRRDMEASGLSVTNRFSPGYCEWDVAEQFKLFQYFPQDSCKVRLTSSALMEPVKSVSGIIGVGKEVSTKEYPCRRCTRENCMFKNGLQQ